MWSIDIFYELFRLIPVSITRKGWSPAFLCCVFAKAKSSPSGENNLKSGLYRAGVYPRDEKSLRQLRATYYGLMTEVDDNIGKRDCLGTLHCFDRSGMASFLRAHAPGCHFRIFIERLQCSPKTLLKLGCTLNYRIYMRRRRPQFAQLLLAHAW